MKAIKVKILMTAFSVLVLMTGCNKSEKPAVLSDNVTLTATAERNDVSTKAGFAQDGAFYWSSGDRLGVTDTDGSSFCPLDLKAGKGEAKGTFTGDTGGGAIGEYAVYPYDAEHSVSGTELTFNFPADYTYTKVDGDYFTAVQGEGNSFNAPMWGKINSGSVMMRHLGGVLCVKIDKMPVAGGTFILTADKKISGKYTADLSAAEPRIEAAAAAADAEKSVSIAFSGAVKNSSGVFYVPVPAGDYNIDITLKDNSSAEQFRTYCGGCAIDRRTLKKVEIKTAETVLKPSELTAKLKTMSDNTTLAGCGTYVQGIVTANNSGGNLKSAISVEDGTGEPNSGIYVYNAAVNSGFNIGDEVKIKLANAKFKKYHNLREVVWDNYNNDVAVISSGNAFVTPEITANEFLSDNYQGMYVTVKNVKSTHPSGTKWYESGSGTNRTFEDGTAQFSVRTCGTASWKDESIDAGIRADISGVAQKYEDDLQFSPVSVNDISAFIFDENQGGGDEPSPVGGGWMELPEVNVSDGFMYVSHTAELTSASNSRIVRNYSIFYDIEHKIALWVAYPLCQDYLGDAGRNDKWGYDPKIPSEYQPKLNKGWPDKTYDRGHQLPSASRTSSKAINVQTFYYTNMTAQVKTLNQGVWAKTEGKVRGYIHDYDTLYVVTGPVLTTDAAPEITYTNDNASQKVAVPKAYFKVLLGYDISDNSYKSIGFWFENKSYDTKRTPQQSDLRSVAEIEQLTGIKFFENLPDNIEDAVKSQFEPAKWGF